MFAVLNQFTLFPARYFPTNNSFCVFHKIVMELIQFILLWIVKKKIIKLFSMLKGLLPENAAEFYDTIDTIILILSL